MSQDFLTSSCIVTINAREDKNLFYLSNRSFIRSQIFLTSQINDKDYENYLFYVEVDGGSKDIKMAIQFGQRILFRHKISSRYLTHSEQFEQEENDTTYKLKLSHKKHFFQIFPCFQYQTKITNKIKFDEDLYLATSILDSNKIGYISTRHDYRHHLRKTLLGINYKTKFTLRKYYQFEKDENNYVFGTIFWLSHIESSTFLNVNRKMITFQPLQLEKDIQQVTGLWSIESCKMGEGGKISYEQKFRIKNLATGAYLSFSPDYVMKKNVRVYQILMQPIPSEQSVFVFRSLKGEDNKIKKNSYLIFRHAESKLFIGCRKNNFYEDTQNIKPFFDAEFSDEDLYKILELDENQQEAIRFIMSIKEQLNRIINGKGEDNQSESLQICENIENELEKLKKFESLFPKVQTQLGSQIQTFSKLIPHFKRKMERRESNFEELVSVIKKIYSILTIICLNNKSNQALSYKYAAIYIEDIFFNYGSEELLIQTFKNNYNLLCRVSKPLINMQENIIRASLEKVERFWERKDSQYWIKMKKFLQLLKVLMRNGQTMIDINQRLISQELFDRGKFRKVFFNMKIINQCIKVEQLHDQYVEIEKVSNQYQKMIVEDSIQLFSLLCSHRNFIAKKCVHQFLNSYSHDGNEVLISYLNDTKSSRLSNNLYALISNLYIDSSPRIDRYKPLCMIKFAFSSAPQSVREQLEITGRLRNNLLGKIQESYRSRPLQISNILLTTLNMSVEPTLSLDELALYKEELYQKIKENYWSSDVLRAIQILISLETYSNSQMVAINQMLISKLKSSKLDEDVGVGILTVIQQISLFSSELKLEKLSAYLRYKYRISNEPINEKKQSDFLLPFPKKIVAPPNQERDLEEPRRKYNELCDSLERLNPDEEIKRVVLDLFTRANDKTPENYLQPLFQCIVQYNLHCFDFLKNLMNSIVITRQEEQTFITINDLFKKLRHLISISEYWLCSREGEQNLPHFLQYMVELTRYLHEGYEGSDEKDHNILKYYIRSIVHEDKIYVNRQLLIRNFGFHIMILQLLESNYYLLENQDKNSKEMAKAIQVFTICFQFLYGFIYKCQETKQIIHRSWSVLNKFQNLYETGQTRLYNQLYSNKIEYIREIKKSSIEKLVRRIIKDTRKTHESCQFNPEHLQFFESIVKVNESIFKPNLQKLYRSIEKDTIFKKIFYSDQLPNGQIRLCLDIFKIKTDGSNIQIPYLYHVKLLGLVNQMHQNLQSQSTIIRSKLQKIFSIDYLLSILSSPDIYSHIGVEPQMNFLLKREIMKIFEIFLERNDSIHKLHNNEKLEDLVDFYYQIFVKREKKKKKDAANQPLYRPYLRQYEKILDYYENSERIYYQTQIKPFLLKIISIHKKANKDNKNKICEKINFILEEADPDKMVQFYQYRKMDKKIDKVIFKWLNFVDRDENNSPQQKFAKCSVIELLRSKQIENIVIQERKKFYLLLNTKKNDFARVTIQLLNMKMDQELIEGECEACYQNILEILSIFSDYLQSFDQKSENQEFINFLLEQDILNILIKYTTKPQFDFSKIIIRKIYHHSLKVLNFLLRNDEEQKTVKQLYKMATSNKLLHRFWMNLKQSISTMYDYIQGTKNHEQINYSLNYLRLIPEQSRYLIYEEALLFLEGLCEHHPFTTLLRHQPFSPSYDFLETAYHTFNYILFSVKPKTTSESKICVKVSIVDLAQGLLNFMSAMMYGRNINNQNYLIDYKFPEIIYEVIKILELENYLTPGEILERNRLLQEVIEFYHRNGIDISHELKIKIKRIDFNHPYLLYRFKYSLLKTLMQCISSNQKALSKVRLQIPIQSLKVSLIWLFLDYKQGQHEYIQKQILREKEKWDCVIEKENDQINKLFLMIGFYFFYLIQTHPDNEEEKNDDDEAIVDIEKKKQKIVRKFFSTLSEKQKKDDKISKLNQKEDLTAQMKKFYEDYYEAMQFFREKTLTIQVDFHSNLTRVYFPKIPLCDGVTKRMEEDFKHDAVRISQEQKIKSLLQFEEESYEFLQGEEDFFAKFESLACLQIFLRSLNQNILRLVGLISCFILSVLFLVDNFLFPSFVFQDNMVLQPVNALEIVMFILGVINMCIALLLIFYLFVKKTPILLTVLRQREKKRKKKQREKFLKGKYFYIIREYIPEIAYLFYIIVFLTLSFIHPMFAGFVLFDVMDRMELGRQINRSVKETWFQLLAAIILLIVINFIYALWIFIQWTSFYKPTCENLFQCLLLLLDQSLKSDSGFLGSTPIQYEKSVFDLKFFSELVYIIFAQKVVFQIFSGTIIDKFSELRQQNNAMAENQAQMCFMCGQQRFVLDFQLEGFQQHTERSHNTMNYVFYLFYIQRMNKRSHGIIQKYVHDCQMKQKKDWIPNQTSILLEEKQRMKIIQEKNDEEGKHQEYLQKKMKDLKILKSKTQKIISELKSHQDQRKK